MGRQGHAQRQGRACEREQHGAGRNDRGGNGTGSIAISLLIYSSFLFLLNQYSIRMSKQFNRKGKGRRERKENGEGKGRSDISCLVYSYNANV